MGPAVKPASPKMLEWFSWQGRGFYVIEVILLGVRSSQALPVATWQSNPLPARQDPRASLAGQNELKKQ